MEKILISACLMGYAVRYNGRDKAFISATVARWAQDAHCRFALLTDGSPTCGSQRVYDGGFRGQQRPGQGVAAALLRQHGIAVYAETQLAELIQRVAEAER